LAFVKNAKGTIEVELIDLTGKVIKKMPDIEWDYPHTGFDENGICSVHLILPTGKLCRALMDKTGKVIWKGGPFDYCFPKNSLVTMADNSQKAIQEISVGDMVLTLNTTSGKFEHTKVIKTEAHAGTFGIVNIQIASAAHLLTNLHANDAIGGFQLQCTPNHPIHTMLGKVDAGDLTTGCAVFVQHPTSNTPTTGIVSVNYATESVSEVYNIVTESGNYVVNGVVVLVK
jgi:hypothetical protein